MKPVYHLIDHAGLFNRDHPFWREGGGGWQAECDFHRDVIDHFKCPVCIRQPIPTASTDPIHIDGWLQTYDRPVWHDGFLPAMKDLQRHGRGVLYVGHPGGDEISFGRKPYKPSPELEKYINQGNRFRDSWEAAISPYDRSDMDIAFDGSNHIGKDTPYFKAMELWRVTLLREGRWVYVESAADLRPPEQGGAPWFRDYGASATWAWFENKVDKDQWVYPDMGVPGLIFVWSNPPAGGWQFDGHNYKDQTLKPESAAELARRFRLCWQHNATPTAPLRYLMNAGHQSVDDFAKEYA